MPQVLAPSDVLKLGMIVAFYNYQGPEEQGCVLSEWLLRLWMVLLFELVCKFLVQVCVAKPAVAAFLVSLVLFGETCWNVYGLYLFFRWREEMQCSEGALLTFKIALGLFIASNVSAVLLVCCRAEPAKPPVTEPAGPPSAVEQGTKPHSN